MFPKVVDVTGITGQRIGGALTSWQTRDGPYNVEHVAATAPNGDLVVFWWSPRHDWQVVNVTAKTGAKIKGRPVSWQTQNGPYNVEHVAALSPKGHVLVFWWSPMHDWQVVDVSAKTHRTIATDLAAWQTPNGPYNVEHLAGVDDHGDLFVFWWSPVHDWQCINVSQIAGRRIASPVTAWQTPDGPMTVEHLAGHDQDGHVIVFWWSPAHDWQAIDVTQWTDITVVSPLCSWQVAVDTRTIVEHLAAEDRHGSLRVFWWSSGKNWQSIDVTRITGRKVRGVPAPYQLAENGRLIELLATTTPEGALLLHWWRPDLDWQAIDVSEMTGEAVESPPEAWVAPNLIEHSAGQGKGGRLLVSWGDREPRSLIDGLSNPIQGLKRQRHVRRKVVAILWNADTTIALPSVADVESVIFGANDSVRQFYLENSNGYFTIDKAAVLGWYPADKPAAHYFGAPDLMDSDGDGFVNGHVEKWTEAIRKAAADFDFTPFDLDGDGQLAPTELAVLIVMPGTSPFGTNRVTLGAEYPNPMPLVVQGKQFGMIAEVYIGGVGGWPLNLGVVAHELNHLVLGGPDEYVNFFQPFAPGMYSLMDNTYSRDHLDPLLKLKHGWLQPRLVVRSGTYSLGDVATSHQVLVLIDPSHATDEYFVIENRSGSGTYDDDLPDPGLAVWHIMENSATFGAAGPPPNVKPSDWASIGAPDWGRRVMWLIRPRINSPLDQSISTWDSSAYDLLSVDPNPEHATLVWADGTPSGFAIKSVSASGPIMTAEIEVPF